MGWGIVEKLMYTIGATYTIPGVRNKNLSMEEEKKMVPMFHPVPITENGADSL